MKKTLLKSPYLWEEAVEAGVGGDSVGGGLRRQQRAGLARVKVGEPGLGH